jgi:hypothetical protein
MPGSIFARIPIFLSQFMDYPQMHEENEIKKWFLSFAEIRASGLPGRTYIL